MSGSERRRVERHALDVSGELHLAGGRRLAVRIVNLGQLGALLSMAELEDAVEEGERVLLRHPLLEDGEILSELRSTPAIVVRVELDFSENGLQRHLAVFFDGGGLPEGVDDEAGARSGS